MTFAIASGAWMHDARGRAVVAKSKTNDHENNSTDPINRDEIVMTRKSNQIGSLTK